jgi:hypothetical protein
MEHFRNTPHRIMYSELQVRKCFVLSQVHFRRSASHLAAVNQTLFGSSGNRYYNNACRIMISLFRHAKVLEKLPLNHGELTLVSAHCETTDENGEIWCSVTVSFGTVWFTTADTFITEIRNLRYTVVIHFFVLHTVQHHSAEIWNLDM